MTNQNRNPFAPEALPAQPSQLRHPFFDTTLHPTRLDCLDALDRAACVIELLRHLDPDKQTATELTPRAISGYRCLTQMLRETFIYSSHRLATLSRKRQRKRRSKARKKARYLAALQKSLTALDTADRDHALDTVATRLPSTQSDIDAFVVNAE